jgi:hypothetical protein
VTPTWVVVVVAVGSGLAGSVVSVWLTSRHERVSDLRGRVLGAAVEFSQHSQYAFGPVKEAVEKRFAQPEEYDEDDVPDDDAEPEEYWSAETLAAFYEAKSKVLVAEAKLTPLLLLLREDCQALRSALKVLDMLSVAVGSLTEIPRDPRPFTDNYVLRAGLEWRAFNTACQRELRRVGRWVPPWTRRRERARHDSWLRKEEETRTFVDPDGMRRVSV